MPATPVLQDGILQKHGVRVTVYPRFGKPMVFGLTSESTNRSQLLEVGVSRQIGQPNAATFVLPGRKSPGGAFWADIIRKMDFVQIDACVMRNPDRLSQRWRTIFAGYVQNTSRSSVMGADFSEATIITSQCAMGVLNLEAYNYWRDAAFTAGQQGDAPAFLNYNGLGDFNIVNSIARVTSFVFNQLIAQIYPLGRTVNGVEYDFSQTYGLRVSSDPHQVNAKDSILAPDATTWIQMIEAIVDAPVFYEIFSEMLPEPRWKPVIYPPRSTLTNPVDTGTPKLIFPSQAGAKRAQILTVRPKPFPTYDPNFGGFDSRAWDGLPLFQEIPELGAFTVQSDSPLDYIFSLYATRAIPWSSGNANDAAINADANNQVLFDFDKWKNMVGVKELTVASRRNPVATYGQDGKPTPGQGLSYGAFIARLNWELFSYNQFNDLFQNGNLAGPTDLDLELGSKFIAGDMLYYIEGYTHSFSAEQSTTQIAVSRGLPTAFYQEGFRETLGRKRVDEELAPIQGKSNAHDEQKYALDRIKSRRGI